MDHKPLLGLGERGRGPVYVYLGSLAEKLAGTHIHGTEAVPGPIDEVPGAEDASSIPEPIEVETEIKHGKVRFTDPDGGHTVKTQKDQWQECSSDFSPYFLYTSESGRMFWTWELGSASEGQASGSSTTGGRKGGKGKGKQQKK
ncbi:hypothetical protein F4810DRAFT_715230 [Camillea tinctor]|nr:hypothetical protein F4810DRAFT_715230 [Camillea tinctor]